MPNANTTATPDLEDEIVPCKLCGTTSSQFLVRIRDLCEKCFTKQFIDPLKKEERNLNDALAILRNNTMTFLHELGEAKRADQTYRMRMAKTPKTYLCSKCHNFKSDSYIAHNWHEESCTGKGYGKTTKATGPKTVKSPMTPKDKNTIADEMFN